LGYSDAMSADYRRLLGGVIGRFAIYGDLQAVEPFGGGHINGTFRSTWNQAGARVRYTHQRINEQVFHKPDEVMDNIVRVTRHIAGKLSQAGRSDISRRVLTVVPARDGAPFVRDSEGGFWRTYLFIEASHTLDVASSPEEARVLGRSVGLFQRQLSGIDGPRLHEGIPAFHDMEKRYARFHTALAKDALGRAKEAREEIAFLEHNEERGALLIRALRDGTLPERICHNDTKMNNILLDDATGEALCVLDLDTVMPGTPLFDTGDLIRSVPATAVEDERDLSKVGFSLPLFQALIAGYLSEAREFLTERERSLILESGRNITQIMALRFFTDYLEGDHYYRIDRPGHNLDRCRNQIALVKSLDAQWEKAAAIVQTLDR